jgi:hypothetical protein
MLRFNAWPINRTTVYIKVICGLMVWCLIKYRMCLNSMWEYDILFAHLFYIPQITLDAMGMCKYCKQALCIEPCFKAFHKDKKLQDIIFRTPNYQFYGSLHMRNSRRRQVKLGIR